MKLLEKLELVIRDTVYDSAETRIEDIDLMVEELASVVRSLKVSGGRLFFIGNGGSAAIAIHMTADYLKNGGITTVSMHDAAMLTCLGNDYGYEYVFSKQLELHMKEDDILVAISSSGNSANIINAIAVAQKKNARVISFTGFKNDNRARTMADYSVYVPSMEYGIVESVHNLILQEVVDRVKILTIKE